MHVMLDEEQGDALCAASGGEALAQRGGLRWMKPGGRPSAKKEPRRRQHRAHGLDPLLYAIRHVADGGVLVMREAGIGERSARRLAPAVAANESDRLQHAAQSAVATMLA